MKFINKYYKVLIPVSVLLVLLIASFFLYKEYKYDNTKNKVSYNVFQYYNGVRSDYKLEVTYNLKDKIVDINSLDRDVEFDSMPIYFEGEDTVLFPKEMTVVFPLKDGSQFKLNKYGEYKLLDDKHYLSNNNDIDSYDYFFLYDGKNLYFFPDDVVLKIGSREIKLGGGSYVTLIGSSLIYFDYKELESKLIEVEKEEIKVINDDIDLNVREKHFRRFSKDILLFGPSLLDSVSK